MSDNNNNKKCNLEFNKNVKRKWLERDLNNNNDLIHINNILLQPNNNSYNLHNNRLHNVNTLITNSESNNLNSSNITSPNLYVEHQFLDSPSEMVDIELITDTNNSPILIDDLEIETSSNTNTINIVEDIETNKLFQL